MTGFDLGQIVASQKRTAARRLEIWFQSALNFSVAVLVSSTMDQLGSVIRAPTIVIARVEFGSARLIGPVHTRRTGPVRGRIADRRGKQRVAHEMKCPFSESWASAIRIGNLGRASSAQRKLHMKAPNPGCSHKYGKDGNDYEKSPRPRLFIAIQAGPSRGSKHDTA